MVSSIADFAPFSRETVGWASHMVKYQSYTSMNYDTFQILVKFTQMYDKDLCL